MKWIELGEKLFNLDKVIMIEPFGNKIKFRCADSDIYWKISGDDELKDIMDLLKNKLDVTIEI